MPKSGLWLLNNPKFIEWRKSSAKSMLWLHGIRKVCPIRVEQNKWLIEISYIAGSGKSKLV